MGNYLHTILVVDDEEIIRDSFEDIFNKRGYHVVKAGDGLEALERIKDNVIDLAIVDVKMPRMDGLTLLKELKKDHPTIPVIMMTGYGSEDTAIKALSEGASNYLKKPFNILNVIDSIEKVLSCKITRDRLLKKELLIKHTLQNLNTLELSFPIDIEDIEGGVIFLSEYLFSNSPYKTNVEVGVHEALLNAYYHGSLNIMGKIQSDAVDFYKLAASKNKSEAVKDKRITLNVTAHENEYVFRITDQGNGFDWRTVSQKVEMDLERKPFGRGITLIKTFFDDISWNEKVNEITMTLKKTSRYT